MSQTRALQSQRGTLGFALGTKNSDGSCKTTSDYEADLDAIKTHGKPTLVRGYSVSDCDSTRNILPAAQNRGFKVVLGYPAQVYAVTVGSETLYRGVFTVPQLLAKINVKALFPNIKDGTAAASMAEAAALYSRGVCGMLEWEVNVLYSEAFDEPWKSPAVADHGEAEVKTHWGPMNAARQLKDPEKCPQRKCKV